MIHMVKQVAGSVIAGLIMITTISSCGKLPVGVERRQTGSVEVQVEIAGGAGGLNKISRACRVQFDSLVISVQGDDMEPVRISRPVDLQQLFVLDTFTSIPAGTHRLIRIVTVNKIGEVVHEDSAGERDITIEPNMVAVLPVTLIPVKGSIYLQLANIPTSVDSIKAEFRSSAGESYSAAVKREPKVFISIDGIDHNTSGSLMVAGISGDGDTLYYAEKEMTVNATALSAVDLVFNETPGGLGMSIHLILPGATLVTASMGSSIENMVENGKLIITEVMYAANDSEYIEIYNPDQNSPVHYDSLIIELDGKERLFQNIQVGAGEYLVIGRISLPWVDLACEVKSWLDLSSNGNMIILKTPDGTVLDRVFFTGGTNQLEWPKVSGKQSIVLSADAFSVEDNNFGRNWRCADSNVADGTSQMGSPGN